jgi:hypothetical protein
MGAVRSLFFRGGAPSDPHTQLYEPTIQSTKQSWGIDAVESGSNHNWVSLIPGLVVLARPSLRQQFLELEV